MTPHRILLWVPLCLAALGGVAAAPVRPAGPDFSREVRPILSRACFKCHGPDDAARQARLRLDLRAEALKGGGSGRPAIAPGKPEASELVRRVLTAEPARQMPPRAANVQLTAAEKAVLRRWVAAGAEYRPHWAFAAPRPSPLPRVRQAAWLRNGIDRFVLARLEAAGMRPSPEADRYTLARRVYLDLIGLPPTPEEADALVNDPSPDAYERLVDRLLASPHYGERWARRWLDLARYADTNGYEKDRPRSIWPYRDWVINALNRDMPFDQFTIEQLAGDMLPNASAEQRIATGFNRNTMLNEEGGIDPLEFRFHAMTDRVSTTATTWLGLTLGCAQCHTHKFDPVSHREYYRFMAFLNNADEPEIDVPQPDVASRRRDLEARIADAEAALAQRFPTEGACSPAEALQRRQAVWEAAEAARAVKWTVLRPRSAKSNMPLLTVLDDHSVISSGDQTKRDVFDLVFDTDLRGITALRLEALADPRLPKGGPGRIFYEGPAGDFFLSEVTLSAAGGPAKLARASQTFASGKLTAAAAIDGDPQTGWSINGAQGQSLAAVFSLEKPLDAAARLELRLLFERYYAANMGRFRVSVTTDPRGGEARHPAEVEAALLVPADERTEEQSARLRQQFLAVAPELNAAREEIKKLKAELPAFPTTLVFEERPANNPRPTFVHRRGEFLQPTERVEPGVLSILPPLRPGIRPDRLAFARWLASPENPLAARVTVNRQWAALFGRGLVRTTEDFGYQGEAPSHPELLDYLALRFARGAAASAAGPAAAPWSLKALHRLLVTSATYRQSSRVSPALLTKDPQNRLLARGPRLRLEAELLRDSALRASGLLSPRIGGPSVFPPQPPGVTSEGTYGPLTWKVSEGEDRYRRGLYTFTKRTAPYAMFLTFDAPSGEACVPRREVTNTPLQALTLLNDTVFVEASQALGKDTASRLGSLEERARHLFRRCVTRPPGTEELALLVRFWEAQRARFARGEGNAAEVAGAGEGAAADRAAWTSLARSLLNLDEAIVKP